MIARIVVAGIITGIVCFFPSALIYGVWNEYVQSNTTHYEGLFKDPPNIVGIIAAGISWGIVMAYILSLKEKTSIRSDFITGSIVFTFILIGIEFVELATKNLITVGVALSGISTNIIVGGFRGLVAGLVLRRMAKKSAVQITPGQ
jgi:hypothetical protein